MKKTATTVMSYQVETDKGIRESLCESLAEARSLARLLRKEGCNGIQIARYDRSGNNDYYEVVEVIS